jgi:hypothetical protein
VNRKGKQTWAEELLPGVETRLQHYNVSFGAADVLSDPELREGIKEYSKWPTIPQVRAPSRVDLRSLPGKSSVGDGPAVS